MEETLHPFPPPHPLQPQLCTENVTVSNIPSEWEGRWLGQRALTSLVPYACGHQTNTALVLITPETLSWKWKLKEGLSTHLQRQEEAKRDTQHLLDSHVENFRGSIRPKEAHAAFLCFAEPDGRQFPVPFGLKTRSLETLQLYFCFYLCCRFGSNALFTHLKDIHSFLFSFSSHPFPFPFLPLRTSIFKAHLPLLTCA